MSACTEEKSEEPKFGPNLNEFVRRFDATTTNNQGVHACCMLMTACHTTLPSPPLRPIGPVWLKNLYFAYLLVLRAVTKAWPLLQGHAFYTGNTTEDEETKAEVMKVVHSAKYEGEG